MDDVPDTKKVEFVTENNKTAVNWDPFSQDTDNITNQNAPAQKQPTETKNIKQPELFDLVYNDEIPKKEDNIVKSSNVSSNMNLADVFGNPQQKEAEERFKKMTLMEFSII